MLVYYVCQDAATGAVVEVVVSTRGLPKMQAPIAGLSLND